MRRQHLQKLHISRLESIGPIIVAMLAKNFKTRLESIAPLIHRQSFPMIHHNLDTMYGTEKL